MRRLNKNLIAVILLLIISSFYQNKTNAQSEISYKALKVNAEGRESRMNREILTDSCDIKRMHVYCSEYYIYNRIYKGMHQVDVNDMISKDDIKELRSKIDFTHYPVKWDKGKLRKLKIKTTGKQLVNKQGLCVYKTAPPLFFKNNTFFVIYVQSYCSPENGSETINVFKKNEKGSYEFIGEIMISIS